jgi:hypothetical protein
VAIKGKKKSRSRTQTRRRPAAAPRPVITGGRRAAWYRTPGGRIGLALAIITLAIVGWVIWNNAKADSEAKQTRQNALEDYTGKVRALLQTVTPPASGMQQVPPAPNEKALAKLQEDSQRWVKTLQKASTDAISLVPPAEIQTTGQLFAESVNLYLTSARIYQNAAGLDDPAQRKEFLQRAAEVRDRATSIWTAAVAMLDAERTDAEMDPSVLRVPTTPSG